MSDSPTVYLGLGAFGEEVLQRISESERESLQVRHLHAEASAAGVRDLIQDLGVALDQLLQAGLAAKRGREEPRLDLLLFASASEGEEEALRLACEGMAALIRQRFAGLFPAALPPDQRRALLQLVLAVPALPSPGAAAALGRVASCEAWADGSPSYPLLSRIWLISKQTSAGVLHHSEQVATCATFALASYRSGLREEEEISRRLQPPRPGEGRVGFLSLASAEAPMARLQDYAALRAAYDALGQLNARVGAAPEGKETSNLLRPDEWLAPFQSGDAAQKVRDLAASFSGKPARFPEKVQLRAFEGAESIRSRLAPLLQPASEDRPLKHEDQAKLKNALEALDRRESGAVAQIERDLDLLLGKRLAKGTGLRDLPAIEAGLGRVCADLRDQQSRDQQEASAPEVRDPDPYREEIEAALDALPKPGPARLAAAAVALVGGGALSALLLAFGSRQLTGPSPAGPGTTAGTLSAPVLGAGSQAASAAASPGLPWLEVFPWLGGAAGGLLLAFLFLFLAARAGRKELQPLLERRRNAMEELWQQGGAGQAGLQAERQLALRRQRVRRSAILALEQTLERLELLRRLLEERRRTWRQRLLALGVSPKLRQAEDDLSSLVEGGGLLHIPLVPPKQLAQWAAHAQELKDPDIWADRFLEACWPPEGDMKEDLPCSDEALIHAAALRQVAPLIELSPFSLPDFEAAATQTILDFAGQVPVALAAPCQPKDAYDNPLPGWRGEALVVAPSESMSSLEQDLAGRVSGMPVLRGPASSARVLFLRTWEGFSTEAVARGAGLRLGEEEQEVAG